MSLQIIEHYERLEKEIKELEEERTIKLNEMWEVEESLDKLEENENPHVVAWRQRRAAARKARRKAKREAEEAATLDRRRARIYQMGDNGHVDVKLYGMSLGNLTDAGVYWGTKAQNAPSYVQVESDKGEWKATNGTRVRLLSVNGMGEIRWTVEPRYNKSGGDSDAAEAFGLVAWDA